jgi:hypothetical protein
VDRGHCEWPSIIGGRGIRTALGAVPRSDCWRGDHAAGRCPIRSVWSRRVTHLGSQSGSTNASIVHEVRTYARACDSEWRWRTDGAAQGPQLIRVGAQPKDEFGRVCVLCRCTNSLWVANRCFSRCNNALHRVVAWRRTNSPETGRRIGSTASPCAREARNKGPRKPLAMDGPTLALPRTKTPPRAAL